METQNQKKGTRKICMISTSHSNAAAVRTGSDTANSIAANTLATPALFVRHGPSIVVPVGAVGEVASHEHPHSIRAIQAITS